ncbi:MAG: glycosyltransferase [Lachnospiraceae bacterium]|nr:glycosyltransferase [Lachnospiraceae bacterium]
MKVLLYCFVAYFEKDIQKIFREQGISYDLLNWTFADKNRDEKFLHHVRHKIHLRQYDFVVSVNYWPLLSVICQDAHIPYIAWCYDNPLNVRNIEDTLGNEVNHVYCFDRIQAETYQKQGFQTVYHLPLAVNSKRLARISPNDAKCSLYHSQVSFVGKLYESATTELMHFTDDYCRGYLEAVIRSQRQVYGAYFIDQMLTPEFMSRINTSFRKDSNTSFVLQPEELNYALACEVTRRDRIVLLSLCGSRFQTKFYSYNDSSVIRGVEKLPPVDYWDEMPYIFAASKINLNPCLRAIQTGINLRAFDIMGCGGFLLSNYQEELAELYVNEEDMVLYDSMEDAIEKIRFYLSHEDLRARIAENGRRKTLEEHDMTDALAYMFTHNL